MIEFNPDGSLKIPKQLQEALIKKRNITERDEKKNPQLKNLFFRNFVLDMYNNKCYQCKTNENLTIHHKRYNWKCPFEDKNQKPDCEKCYNSNIKKFYNCFSCVEVLCKHCHTEKHKQLKISSGDWVGFASTKITEDEFLRCKYCDNVIEEEMLYCPKCSRKIGLSEDEKKQLEKEHNLLDNRLEICQKIKEQEISNYLKLNKDKKIDKEKIIKDLMEIEDKWIKNFCSDKTNEELKNIEK